MAALVDTPTKLKVGMKVKVNPNSGANCPPDHLVGTVANVLEPGGFYDYQVTWPEPAPIPDPGEDPTYYSSTAFGYKEEWIVPVSDDALEESPQVEIGAEIPATLDAPKAISFEEMLGVFRSSVGGTGVSSAPRVEVPKAWVYDPEAYGVYTDAKRLRTQKAKGLPQLPGFSLPTLSYVVAQDADGVRFAFHHKSGRFKNPIGEVFARPAPTRPRHGFVDSRKVKTADEAVKVLEEALAEDPEAELILMPPVNAQLNVVWTPNLLTIGPGHDGATSGKGAVVLPQASEWHIEHAHRMKNAGVDVADEHPYFEVVIDENGGAKFVQLRAGPKAEGKRDYIPEKMTVQHVVEASGDLLEWERKVKEFEPGTVVYHPGGSLATHYGAHCLSSRIPIVISFEPQVGDVLEPTFDLEPYSREAALDGLVAGFMTDLKHIKKQLDYDQGTAYVGHASKINHLVWAAHNSGLLRGQDTYHIGYAMAMILRYGSAACLGEARHARLARRERTREEVYTESFRSPFGGRQALERARWIFEKYPWGAGSIGGRRWKDCAVATLQVDQAIRDFVTGKLEVDGLAKALNVAVDQVHNGGWWLNKWAHGHTFDLAAQGHPIVPARAAISIWEAERLRRDGTVFEMGDRVISVLGKMHTVPTWVPDPKTERIIRDHEYRKQVELEKQAKAHAEYEAKLIAANKKKYEAAMKMSAPPQSGTVGMTVGELAKAILAQAPKPEPTVVTLPPVTYAQGRWVPEQGFVHIQYKRGGEPGYTAVNVNLDDIGVCDNCQSYLKALALDHIKSLAHSKMTYKQLPVVDGDIRVGNIHENCLAYTAPESCCLIGEDSCNKQLIPDTKIVEPVPEYEESEEEVEYQYHCVLCGNGMVDWQHSCDHCGELLCWDCTSEDCCPQMDEDDDEEEEADEEDED